MAYDIARHLATGMYWGGKHGAESFCVADPADATAFGDAHRDLCFLRDLPGIELGEDYEFVRYSTDAA